MVLILPQFDWKYIFFNVFWDDSCVFQEDTLLIWQIILPETSAVMCLFLINQALQNNIIEIPSSPYTHKFSVCTIEFDPIS